MSKIFSHAPAAAPMATASSATPGPPAASAPVAAPPPAAVTTTPSTPAPAAAPPVPAPATPPTPVDVTAILDGLAAKNPEKLDWKKSIVDLMKLVGMDSSFGARKELAKELHYTGDPNDSAAMNIWLHKQVLTKIAENGGKVPAELLG
jgi:3-oxoacyl-ACP reductase-like protein